MKLKKSYLLVLGLFLLLCIPLIIEYLINPRYITASDALAFWGAIIGASVAIFGVYLTLNHSNKQTQQLYEENQKNLLVDRSMGVYPYLHIVTDGWFSGSIDLIKKYINHGNYIIIDDNMEDNVIIFQKMLCDVSSEKDFNEVFMEYNLSKSLNFDIYKIINSGVGTASNIFIKTNFPYDIANCDLSIADEANYDDVLDGFFHIPLKPNDEIVLVFGTHYYNKRTSYKFDVSYIDVYGNKYSNTFEFENDKKHGFRYIDNSKQMIKETTSLYKEYKALM